MNKKATLNPPTSDLEIEPLTDNPHRETAAQIVGSMHHRINSALGAMLTLTEVALTDPSQQKAFKDHLRREFSAMRYAIQDEIYVGLGVQERHMETHIGMNLDRESA